MNSTKIFLVLLFSAIVASCGGGGGGTGAEGTPPVTQTITGTAAKGLAIASTTVTIRDVNGKTTAGITGANGSYIVNVSGMALPFLMQVPAGTTSPSYLYSVATATGTANIHPFTDLIIRNWYAANGMDVDAAFAGPPPLKLPSTAEINTIELVVRNILSTWLANVGLSSSTFNLITTPFPANSSGFDKVLDNTAVVINATTGNVTVASTDPITREVTPFVTAPITNLPTPTTDTKPPSAPTGLSTSPASTGSVVLQWNASTDNVGVVGYDIYRNGNKIGSSPYPGYSDTGLTPGTLYSYTVKALDGALNYSAASNTASAATPTLAAVATINDFAGIWNGNVASVISGTANGTGARTNCTFILNLAIYSNQLIGTLTSTSCTGGTASAPVAPISGFVSNGVYFFNLPNSDLSDPNCSHWNVPVTATLDSSLTTMTFNSSGTVCGTPSLGNPASMTGTASRVTSMNQFDGVYAASILGTQANDFPFAVTNGVISPFVAGNSALSGTISSSGAVTMVAPKNSSSLGTPCDDITFTGQASLIAAGGATVAGTWSTPAGAPDPIGTTCPAASGTWAATRL